MEHPMPVGKTFPTNPSTPQKEARSFSIKDEKTTIIPSSDEMPPAGKADYDSAQNNQDKENRQSDRPTGNVRHQTFFPHSRKPEQKEKVRLRKYARRERQTLQSDRPSENGGQNSANAETVRRVKQPDKFRLFPTRRLYRQFNRRGHKTNRNFQEPRSE